MKQLPGFSYLITRIRDKTIILWRAALKPEYLIQSGHPLLDSGSVTMVPLPLPGSQLDTFTRQRVHK
jgi:hypothetical protein